MTDTRDQIHPDGTIQRIDPFVDSREMFIKKLNDFDHMTIKELQTELNTLDEKERVKAKWTLYRKLTYEYSSMQEVDKQLIGNWFKKGMYLSLIGVGIYTAVAHKGLKQLFKHNWDKTTVGRLIKHRKGVIVLVPMIMFLFGDCTFIALKIAAKYHYLESHFAPKVTNDVKV